MTKKLVLDPEYLKFEERLFKKVVSVRKEDPFVMSMLSETLCKLKKHEEALEIDEMLVNKYPEDPIFRYNLACSYSQLERFDESLRELELAIKYGFENTGHIYKDADMKPLIKNYPEEVKSLIQSAKQLK